MCTLVHRNPQGMMGCQVIERERKEKRIRLKKREVNGLLYTEMLESGTRIMKIFGAIYGISIKPSTSHTDGPYNHLKIIVFTTIRYP